MNHKTDPGKANLPSNHNADGTKSDYQYFRESFEFNRTLLESAPYPVVVSDLDSSISYVNLAFESLSGFTSQELIGQKSPYPWWPEEKVTEYEDANTTGRAIELNKLERYYRKKNGEIFWVALNIAPVRFKGNTRNYIANYVDITERKRAEAALQESEARFRMLSENALAGIFILRNRFFHYVNPALATMLGRTRDEMIKFSPSFFIHPEDRKLVNTITMKRLRGEETHVRYAFRCIRGDGKTIWLEALSTLFEDQGHPALLGTVLDITEQKQAEEEADRLRQVITHVSRVNTLGEMAASLAHELNQPLTAIMANARTAMRILQNGKTNIEDIKEILEDITADDQRAGDIIRRMREPLKRGELNLELLDVNNLIKEIYPLVRNDALISGVTMDLKLESGLPRIRGDRTQLQQVLLNLMVNALDAVKELVLEHRWVEVHSSLNREQCIQVAVSDSGPGIPEALREHLFEPLYTTKPDGLGFGLSISKNLIEAHSGRIWSENRPEGGARFIFSLPIERIPDSNQEYL